jgi:hypothetical protein
VDGGAFMPSWRIWIWESCLLPRNYGNESINQKKSTTNNLTTLAMGYNSQQLQNQYSITEGYNNNTFVSGICY